MLSSRHARRAIEAGWTALLALLCFHSLAAQQQASDVTVTVTNASGTPLPDVAVRIEGTQSHAAGKGVTGSGGTVNVHIVAAEPALITASAHGMEAHLSVQPEELKRPVHLVLYPALGAMEFSDAPTFNPAGITDWTAAGGHGSDTTLRASESLATATAALPNSGVEPIGSAEESRLEAEIRDAKTQAQKAQAQEDVRAALRSHPTATLVRLSAEADEANRDPLTAVREFAKAAEMDPSEANLFEWGSELLLHRAILQAQQTFARGAALYPNSVRMHTALGTALFAAARYEEAAAELCRASDLAPNDADPYRFMGKVEVSAPHALVCVEPRLARYAQLHPASSEAQYLYAMAIVKRLTPVPNTQAASQAEELLKSAVGLDPKCGDAYFQLGLLAAQQHDIPQAIDDYRKAIDADPKMAEAYYRLAQAYERTGESEKAKAALSMHQALVHEQAAATEQQRRAVKQFVFAKPGDSPGEAVP